MDFCLEFYWSKYSSCDNGRLTDLLSTVFCGITQFFTDCKGLYYTFTHEILRLSLRLSFYKAFSDFCGLESWPGLPSEFQWQ